MAGPWLRVSHCMFLVLPGAGLASSQSALHILGALRDTSMAERKVRWKSTCWASHVDEFLQDEPAIRGGGVEQSVTYFVVWIR